MPEIDIEVLEKKLDDEEAELRKKRKRLIMAAVLATAGFAILVIKVSWWCGLGVFLAMWGDNISTSTKV